MQNDEKLYNKTLRLLQDKHQRSGGNCGTYIPEILSTLNTTYKEVRHALNRLYKEDRIKIRPGSRGNLIMLKSDRKRKIVRRRT